MFILIARISSFYRNILSQENKILTQFDIDSIDRVEFNPGYKLEDDE